MTTVTTATSTSVIANYAMDANNIHQPDHQNMVDLSSSRCKLYPTRALPVANTKQTPPPNILPQFMTTTTTPKTNDANDHLDDQQ